jgi:ATP-dependent 26S proteasome regulatory subunit
MSCFFVTPAERAEAQLEAAEAQQQASEKAQEAAEAKRVQDEQAAEKRASDLEEQKEVERQKAAQRAEEQAENAPDNTCRTPSVIGDVMDQMNAMPLIEGEISKSLMSRTSQPRRSTLLKRALGGSYFLTVKLFMGHLKSSRTRLEKQTAEWQPDGWMIGY